MAHDQSFPSGANTEETRKQQPTANAGDRLLTLMIANESGVRTVPLTPPLEVIIGRADACDIPISDPLISRQHARLVVGERVQLFDLGSANGTYVRGNSLAAGVACTLGPGDAVEIGATVLVVRPTIQFDSKTHQKNAATEAPTHLSPSMQALHQAAERVARSKLPVLIQGETGSGKDVLAERIHASSTRADKPFVRINCAALSPTLLESELFGHEKGAYTGAVSSSMGLLRSAQGGTVFLDEIAELPVELQSKLLIAVERGEVLPVGSTRSLKIDVRFIAATNADLDAAMSEGTFRRDLYHRLEGVRLHVPPLRERIDEIPGLARRFLAGAAETTGCAPPEISASAMAALCAYDWPGNIRQLRMIIERAVVLGDGPAISASSLDLPSKEPLIVSPIQQTERGQIIDLLSQCAGNQSRVAKMLGVSRTTLIARIEKYGIGRPKGSWGERSISSSP